MSNLEIASTIFLAVPALLSLGYLVWRSEWVVLVCSLCALSLLVGMCLAIVGAER